MNNNKKSFNLILNYNKFNKSYNNSKYNKIKFMKKYIKLIININNNFYNKKIKI